MLILCACSEEIGPAPGDAGLDGLSMDGLSMDASDSAADGSAVDVDLADVGQDATDAGPGLQVERWGGRVYGQALGLRIEGRQLFVGTQHAVDNATAPATARGGFVRLSLDGDALPAGSLRIWDDELPRFAQSPTDPSGPIHTGESLSYDGRQLIVTPAGLLTRDGDTFTLTELEISGGVLASPRHIAIDQEGGRNNLWVSTSSGILRLNPDSLVLLERFGAEVLGSQSTGSIAVDSFTGALYVVVYSETGSTLAYLEGGEVTDRLTPGEDEVPVGVFRDVVFDRERAHVWVAVESYLNEGGGVVGWDTRGVQVLATGAELSTAAHGAPGPFGANVLHVDNVDDVLVVGARMAARTGASPVGGGVVWIDLATADGELHAAGLTSGSSDLSGDHVEAITYDPVTDRTYLSLRHICSESRLGNAGLSVVTFDADGTPHFELPWLSGVRAFARVGDQTAMALRDDAPGIACQGINTHASLVSLVDTRAAVPLELDVPRAENFRPSRYSANALAFRDDTHFAIAGYRQSIVMNGGENSGPLEFGVSLYTEALAWEDDAHLWVGGRAVHSAGEPDSLANVGPRGVARVTLDETGRVVDSVRYVLAERDPSDGTVEGLPSSQVYAVVPSAEGTFVISGIERVGGTSYDRREGEPFVYMGSTRLGGVARVDERGGLEVLDDGTLLPDGRAAALDALGTLHVLNADGRLYRLDDGTFSEVELPGDIPEGSLAHGLWFGAGDDLVATFSTGALVRLGGITTFIDGVGHSWDALQRRPGALLLGTDMGLVRVRAPGVDEVSEPAAQAGHAPPYERVATSCERPLTTCGGLCIDPDTDAMNCGGCDLPCRGSDSCVAGRCESTSCLPEGARCASSDMCCDDLICGGGGVIRSCVPSL
ncbi:MAG: hypothetical protein ACI9KE_002864 [Polyangiales bacterium]|jgi:hypothetical protein